MPPKTTPVMPPARPSTPLTRPSLQSTPLKPLTPASPSPLATPPAAPRASQPTAPITPTRPSMPTPVAGTAGRKPVNPFLSNDPNLKARRLARALVSDMIAYLPEKREQGLREGTLKALFKEEIKKSFEEYVEQVGKDFADSTTHFQEALNDLLAGGQKMF